MAKCCISNSRYIYNVSMGAMPPQLVLRVKHITHP